LASMAVSFIAGMVGCLAMVFILGAGPTNQNREIRAKSISTESLLIGTAGSKARIHFFATPDAESATFYDSAGGARLVLSVIPDGYAFFSVLDKSSRARLTVRSEEDKFSLTVRDASERDRIVLGQTSLVYKSSGVSEDTTPGSITILDE